MRINSFDGLDLMPWEAEDDFPLEFKSNLVELPGQAGAFDADGNEHYRKPLIITRTFEIVESDYGTVDDTLDALRAKANKGLRRLICETRNGDGRQTWAKLKAVKAPQNPEHFLYLPVTLTFEVTWPWLEEQDDIGWFLDTGIALDGVNTLDEDNITTQVGVGTFDIDNDGGDVITRLLMVIKGSSTNPSITNTTTGESISYSGTVASGSSLVIDCGALAAWLDGGDVYSGISIGDMQTQFFSLAVGSNSITFSGGGTLEIHWVRVY